MHTNNRIQSIALFLGVMLMASQVMSHSGAMGIVKQRMDAMKTMGDHAKSVGDMLKGKSTFELTAVEEAARAFITHGEQIPDLFPDTTESRTGSETEALPAIWEDWDDFTALSRQLTENGKVMASITDELSTGTISTDEQSRAVRAAFFKASKSCSGCHERFRLEQD